MTLAPGVHLDHYEISAPLGVGGMGEIYAARDTRLDRAVAIEVLPADFAKDADRLKRFEQEARCRCAKPSSTRDKSPTASPPHKIWGNYRPFGCQNGK